CIGVLFFLFFYLISLIRGQKKHPDWFDTFYDWYNRILIPLGFAFVCLTGYFEIYPPIPQELGGPAPRCARVHLIRSEVDSDSLQALGSEATGDSTVMRTLPLRVYFSGNEFLLVRPPAKQDPIGNTAKKRWTARDETLYELRNDAIRVIEWCGDGEQAAPGPVNGN